MSGGWRGLELQHEGLEVGWDEEAQGALGEASVGGLVIGEGEEQVGRGMQDVGRGEEVGWAGGGVEGQGP